VFDTSSLLIALVVAIGLFLLLREFYCWYFKINEVNRNLERIRELLEAQNRWQEQDHRERSQVSVKAGSATSSYSISNPSLSTLTAEEHKIDASAPAADKSLSTLEQISLLRKRLDAGEITKDEFDQRHKAILSMAYQK